ncbi:zinc metalloprotease HtpX [Candidatus Nomurabacteria bacterium RIFCSPLOWO2_01_FULL_40_15]|uniref:Protease HtpX homolog n=1 Tax=Candidatus Nomurabacteria bacterium RIFCSPLOWO2_01_FULL_40_15 TaxID=1801772 RepID=A0A1F6X8F4_9BACT|nr:MAG: zinc metalloprotease HtpX [Candidatus Nomurabacteria bacterium RIFCSPLOWO2_01_FULL_40_15]
MATLYTQQSKNITKTWVLMSLFLVVVIVLGFVFSQYYGNPNILYIFIIFSIVMNITSYWYSDKIALKLNGAKQIKREDNIELWNIVENLSITAGLPMPKLCIINDPAPNAFATGRNKEHAAVAVTTGLMTTLNKSELEGVIGHELSHIGNRDILLSTVVVVLVGFVAIVADIFLRSMFWGGGRRDSNNSGGGVIMILGIVLSILAPIFATLIQLAISRKREFLADASGALLTRYPEGLASALSKISQYSRPMQHANTATAHLFISNPFGTKEGMGKKISNLFSTHPRTEERVQALVGK